MTRMRILVVSNIYPPVVRGGYEVECSGAVGILRARGDDVLVLTSRAGGRGARAAAAGLDVGVAREIPASPNTKRAQLAAAPMAVAGSRIARRHLRSFRPDLAFVWNGAQIPHTAIYEILASGTPTAFRVCEHWFGGLFNRDFFLRYLSRGESGLRSVWGTGARGLNHLPGFGFDRTVEADVAVSWVSDFLRERVGMPDGLRPRLERVIHPTTRHAAAFAAVRRSTPEVATIAFVGRLTHEKGADVAVGALGRLAQQGFDARLVLVGGGSAEDEQRLGQLADELGVTDRCTFAGRQDVEGICAVLARSTVLVVPSIWEEPLPITVIEGALARVPIVGSRVGGIPEALTEGEEMLLAAPGDADDLAHAVGAVLSDPAAAEARAARAFARASALSWEWYTEMTTSFVDDAYAALRAGETVRLAS